MKPTRWKVPTAKIRLQAADMATPKDALIDLCAKLYVGGHPDLMGMIVLTESQSDWLSNVAAKARFFCIPADGVLVGGWRIARSGYRRGGKTKPGYLLRLWPEIGRAA